MKAPPNPFHRRDKYAKSQLRQDIASFKTIVEDADIEEVDVPTGQKYVEIAWTDSDGFHVERGMAHGTYREYDGHDIHSVHIDWAEDDMDRTTVRGEQIETLEEGDYQV